jgi:hypothetical protein
VSRWTARRVSRLCTWGVAKTRRRAERKAVPPVAADADRPLLVWRLATVMMGDLGEEITEIELEPLPAEMPAEMPAEGPAEPAAEPVPG